MKEFFTLKLLTMTTWVLIVAISLLITIYNQNKYSKKIAYDVAAANYNKDQAFRAWANSHGGIYVPVDTPRTTPSPYLSHMKERDVVTPSGRQLTLMNPAFIMKQINDEFSGLYGAKVNITALETLNPDSTPDKWETDTIKKFQEDPSIKEVIEYIKKDDKTYMRFMRPIKVAENCLECHGHQSSYANDEVSGGVSVMIPMERIQAIAKDSIRNSVVLHFIIVLFGLVLIHLVYKKEKKAIDELEYFANFDTLSSLANRHAYNEKIAELLANKFVTNIYMLFMDLDNFKTINDSLGHSTGDLLLQNVAKRLQNRITDYEIFARFGGDEFVFIFTNVEKPSIIENIAKRIHNVFEEEFILGGYDIHTSTSIGISSYPEGAIDAESLLKNADIAMYHAKHSGKSRYAFYNDQMNAESKHNLKLENELHKALANDELFLLYQPQIALNNGKMIGAEALIRWNNPKSGLISPIEFIPIAEANGLIMPIGEWIIDKACEQLALWKGTAMQGITISINISAKQLLHQNLHSYIRRAITNADVDSTLLELEITESVVMENINETIEILRDLKTLGVTIAIDDFGTGYSSLSYLKKLPIDKLKIDREFIKDIPDNKDDIAITNAIISLAKSLGLKIVAEGPESGEHIDFLKTVKCDIAQGYYYSKPILAQEIEAFLN